MIVVLFYAIPALWLGYLVGLWLTYLIAKSLLVMPNSAVEFLILFSEPFLIAGFLLVLGGHVALGWELLTNRNVNYNIDATTTYIGAALVDIALLLLGWNGLMADIVLALLIAPNIGAGLIRYATKFTQTAFATLAVLLGLCMVLMVLTWFTGLIRP